MIRNHARPLHLLLTLTAALALAAAPACDDGGGENTADATGAPTDTGATDTANPGADTAVADTAPPDTTPPTIASTTPGNNEVITTAPREIRFSSSELLLPSTVYGAFTVTLNALADGVTRTLSMKLSYDDPEWVLTANDDENYFGASGTYTVTLAASITDVAGNPLGSDYTWTFTRDPNL